MTKQSTSAMSTTAAVLGIILATSASSSSFQVANAFTPNKLLQRRTRIAPIKQSQHLNQVRIQSILAMSTSTDDEVAKLRAAAAKAREDVERLQQELGKSGGIDTTKKVVKKTKNIVELKETILPSLLKENDISKQTTLWSELKKEGMITQFGSANLRTFPVSLGMLEQRTQITADAIFGNGTPEVELDDFKYATLWVTGISSVAAIGSLALLPPNIGATLCYLFAVVPILFLGIGSTAPEVIANAIAGLRGNNKDKAGDGISVSPIERRTRHEAAHFCCGYWCGLPVRSYTVQDGGYCQVEFAVAQSTSSKGYSQTEVAALAVTALSGVVGEVMKYKYAESSAIQDLLLLDQVFRRSAEFIGSAAQQDLTRWGALTAALLLKSNQDKYEQVVEAFAQQKSLEDCIAILES